MNRCKMIELLEEIDKDILMYYKNDAFDTPEKMKLRKHIKDVMEMKRSK